MRVPPYSPCMNRSIHVCVCAMTLVHSAAVTSSIASRVRAAAACGGGARVVRPLRDAALRVCPDQLDRLQLAHVRQRVDEFMPCVAHQLVRHRGVDAVRVALGPDGGAQLHQRRRRASGTGDADSLPLRVLQPPTVA